MENATNEQSGCAIMCEGGVLLHIGSVIDYALGADCGSHKTEEEMGSNGGCVKKGLVLWIVVDLN